MLRAMTMPDTPEMYLGRRKTSANLTPLLVHIDAQVKRQFDVFCADRGISKPKLVEALLIAVMDDPTFLERAAQVVKASLDKDAE